MLFHLLLGRERTLSVTAHEMPNAGGDRITRAENLEFIKDGFDWGAFILPPAFFVQHRMWLALLSYVLGAAGLFFVCDFLGFGLLVLATVLAIAHLLIGSEADELRRLRLTTEGWTMIGQITGSSMLDCERRFLDDWLPRIAMQTGRMEAGAGAASAATGRDGAIPAARGVLGSLLAPRYRG